MRRDLDTDILYKWVGRGGKLGGKQVQERAAVWMEQGIEKKKSGWERHIERICVCSVLLIYLLLDNVHGFEACAPLNYEGDNSSKSCTRRRIAGCHVTMPLRISKNPDFNPIEGPPLACPAAQYTKRCHTRSTRVPLPVLVRCKGSRIRSWSGDGRGRDKLMSLITRSLTSLVHSTERTNEGRKQTQTRSYEAEGG